MLVLCRKLQKVLGLMQHILDQGPFYRFLSNKEHTQVISDVVEDIKDAITDYQVGFEVLVSSGLMAQRIKDFSPNTYLQEIDCE